MNQPGNEEKKRHVERVNKLYSCRADSHMPEDYKQHSKTPQRIDPRNSRFLGAFQAFSVVDYNFAS